ncbi:MAG: phosphotransferase enzyme family protein [Saprospiraceae bacterium]
MLQNVPDCSGVVANFIGKDVFFTVRKLGSGHIHDTYFIHPQNKSPFVLQRLNTQVFTQPLDLINTHLQVYQHLNAQKDFPLQLPKPIAAVNGNYLVQDKQQNVWRAMDFIANSYAVERSENTQQTQQAAEAVGIFLRGLAGLDPDVITPALPGFHDSLQRLQVFRQAVAENRAGRLSNVQTEIYFLEQEAAVFYLVEDLKFPKRVVHSDPKIGNLLFDLDTHAAIAVLDWDTIMPGAIPSDFGDMLRTMAATCPEDEADLSKVGLDYQLFNALVKGFVPPLCGWLTEVEINHLITGARWIILEQMMRFLTNYLNGDVYYKINYPEHNLIRTHNQMTLYQVVKKEEQNLVNIIQRCAAQFK